MSKTNVVVAVPVRNEAERIGECLRALALQRDDQCHEILLLLNNCSDGTATVVRQMIPSLPVRVHTVEVEFPPEWAHAGRARSQAMERAAALAGSEGVVMSTDADSRVYPDWVSANLHYLRNGWDAVAGRAEIDPVDDCIIPEIVRDADRSECEYAAALDELAAILDPDAADPFPRHDEHSGASIAVTASAYREAGGVPPEPVGEDRAFFDALREIDARIRHAPEVRVVVSGRLFGRAKGGMADTIRRRLTRLDDFLDDRLEPVEPFMRRTMLRRRCRAAWIREGNDNAEMVRLSHCLRLALPVLTDLMGLPYFGAAWSAIEKKSAGLVRHRVPASHVQREMARAFAALVLLRNERVAPAAVAADRADIPILAAAE